MSIPKSILRWLFPVTLLAVIGTSVALVACGGLGSLIRVELPPEVVALVPDAPAWVPLNEVSYVYQKFDLAVRQGASKFDNNIERAYILFDFIASLTSSAAATANVSATAAGFGGLGTLLIAGLALMTDRPGTKRREQDAERRGFETGRNGSPTRTPPEQTAA